MKPKWLVALLVVSLVANVAELVVWGVGYIRRRIESQRFAKWVQTGAPRWNIGPLLNTYRPAWDSLGRLYSAVDDELESLSDHEPLDTVRIADVVGRLVRLDVAMTRVAFQSAQALHRPENAGVRAAKLQRWRGMTGLGPDSTVMTRSSRS
jgi:hypothetical protein